MAGLARAVWPLFAATLVLGYLLRAACPVPAMTAPVAGLLLVGTGLLLFWAVRVGMGRLLSFVKGARGEEWVARELAFLPSSFHVFHGLSLGKAGSVAAERDCDHVVAGPSGIFVIETKHWRGKVSIRDGRIWSNGSAPDRDPIDQVKQAAVAIRTLLREEAGAADLDVQPVLCFAGSELTPSVQGVAGVRVCAVEALTRILREEGDVPPASLEAAIQCLETRVPVSPEPR